MTLCLYLLLLFTSYESIYADIPCAFKKIPGQSGVCVCNTTYCDDITREAPAAATYVAYTTSESGQRFNKTRGKWGPTDNRKFSRCLQLDPSTTYQTIEGFGGAVTDAAGINWKSLPDVLQQSLINSYFSDKGLEYNLLRVPIGGCDFSTRPYAYNELPINDTTLSNYTLAPEDYEYKIPMIKAIKKVATDDLHIVATTWSPPLWMKTTETYGGFSRLLKQYRRTYALYHLKFIELYRALGILIWAITTTNEPINGDLSLAKFNSLGWDVSEMGEWIRDDLGPIIRNSKFNNTKILIGDDQRLTVPYWGNLMLARFPEVAGFVDGLAVHFYTDAIIPPIVFEAFTLAYPDKFILATEACEGSLPWQQDKVLLGSWHRAVTYVTDIIEDLNYNLVGWIDWNLCLDLQGGPNWVKNFVDSPIIVDKDKQEFYKQPMFYIMGHFAKFVPRGSIRIKIDEKKPFFSSSLDHVAFVTPRSTIVVIIYNSGEDKTIKLMNDDNQTALFLAAHSVTTVELPNA